MIFRIMGILGFVLSLVACAFDLAHVSYKPTQLVTKSGPGKTFIIKDEVKIPQAPCGYERVLLKGTRWDLLGAIPEGEVYKTKNQVLTVECSHVHEAYLVVSGDSLVGFYLPVEKGFAPISPTIRLPLK